MAEATFRTADSPSKLYPNRRHPTEFGPEDVPEVYASVCKGDCLEPVIKDGACLVFSKTETPVSGDFVGFWLHPDAVGADELPRRVKRLYIGLPEHTALPFRPRSDECEPMIVFEQLNPPRLYHVRASRILAVHKVIGETITNGNGTAQMLARCVSEEIEPC